MPFTLIEGFTAAGQSATACGIRGGDGRYIATYVAAVLAKDHVQIRMCLTKDRYDCKVAAEAAIPHREPKAGRVPRSYHCPHCGGYHLTKMRLEAYLAAE